MMKAKRFILSSLIGGALTSAPFLIVVACGENEDFIDPLTFAQTQISKIQVNGTPTHDNVTWKNVPVAKSPISKYLYLHGDYSTLSAAIAAPKTAWTESLPSVVNYDFARRYLYVRAIPNEGRVFDENSMYFNITNSSNVQNVKSKVDATPNFEKLDLNKMIRLSRRANELQIDISTKDVDGTMLPPVPVGAEINYLVSSAKNTSGWLSGGLFQAYLSLNHRFYDLADLRFIQAKLVSTNESRYLIIDDKLVVVSQNTVQESDRTIPLDAINALNNIQADASSTHDNVTWNSVPTTRPASILKYMYLLGNYPTRDTFLVDVNGKKEDIGDWKDEIPNTVDYDYNKRFLWVKIFPADNFVIEDQYIPITQTSGVQQIQSKVDAQPGYAQVDLSKISLSGRISSLSIDDSTVTNIPFGATLAYSLNYGNTNTGPLDKSSFLTYVRRLTNLPSNDDELRNFKAGVRVYLNPLNTRYIISNDKRTIPIMETLRSTEIRTLEDLRYEFSLLKWLDGSTSSNMIWSKPPSNPSAFTIWYAYGNFNNYAQVEAYFALKNPFINVEILSPPRNVSSIPSERSLWIRILPAPGGPLGTIAFPYIDLTDTSNIRSTLL